MILKGELNLKHDNDDYIMFCGGRLANISEILNMMLFDDVYVDIKRVYNKKKIFVASGKLLKRKVSKGCYLYHIDNNNLGIVLRELINSKIIIEIKNISKN